MLLAVDPLIQTRYGDDLNDFLYLLMSSTSNLFAKANFGYPLKIAVSNIIILPQDIFATRIFSGPKIIGKYVIMIKSMEKKLKFKNKYSFSIKEKTPLKC